PVHQQDFKPEFISEQQLLRIAGKRVGEDGRQDAYIGNPAVPYLPFHEHAEGKESQQRAIRIPCCFEHRGDDTFVVDSLEHDDHGADEQAESHVYKHPGARPPGCFLIRLLKPEEIDAERRGQRSQCGIRARVGRGGDAENECNAQGYGEVMDCQHRIQLVRAVRYRNALVAGIEVQHRAQRKEQEVHEDEQYRKPVHIVLRCFRIAARKVLWHQVLIQSWQYYGDKRAGDKLLEEVIRRLPVRRETPGVFTCGYQFTQPGQRYVEFFRDEVDGENHRRDQKGGLQCVRPDDGFYAALEGVHPDEKDGNKNGNPKGNTRGVEYGKLKHHGSQEQPESGAYHARNQEEECAGLVGPKTETAVEVFVDRDEVQPVV